MLFLHLRHGLLDRVREALATFSAVIIHEHIMRYGGQPRREGAVRRLVGRDGFVDAQENLLAQVLGFGAISGEPVAEAIDATRVTPHEFCPSRPLAADT